MMTLMLLMFRMRKVCRSNENGVEEKKEYLINGNRKSLKLVDVLVEPYRAAPNVITIHDSDSASRLTQLPVLKEFNAFTLTYSITTT